MNYTTEQQITAIEVAFFLLEDRLAELKSEDTQVSLNEVVDLLEESRESQKIEETHKEKDVETEPEEAYEEKGVPTELRMPLDIIKDILMSVL